MENMENTEKIKKNKIFSYLLFVFFICFLITGLLLLNQKKQEQISKNEIRANKVKSSNENGSIKQDTLVIPDQEEDIKSEYSLSLKTDSVDIKPGTIVNVDVYGDSNSKNIVGYDMIIKYDPLAFDYLKLEPVIQDIRIYNYRKDSYLTLTGVRNLQSTAASLLDTKLLSLYFEAKKSGNFEFLLIPSFDNTNTNFITDSTEILVPDLSNLLIEVK